MSMIQTIAEKSGASYNYTCRIVRGESTVDSELARKVIANAQAIGFQLPTEEERAARVAAYNKSRAAYMKARKTRLRQSLTGLTGDSAKMMELRDAGWSNADIAKRFGVSYQTVLYRIGTQPEMMTKMNQLEGSRKRSRAVARRTEVARAVVLDSIRKLEDELAEVEDQTRQFGIRAEHLRGELKKMRASSGNIVQ